MNLLAPCENFHYQLRVIFITIFYYYALRCIVQRITLPLLLNTLYYRPQGTKFCLLNLKFCYFSRRNSKNRAVFSSNLMQNYSMKILLLAFRFSSQFKCNIPDDFENDRSIRVALSLPYLLYILPIPSENDDNNNNNNNTIFRQVHLFSKKGFAAINKSTRVIKASTIQN